MIQTALQSCDPSALVGAQYACTVAKEIPLKGESRAKSLNWWPESVLERVNMDLIDFLTFALRLPLPAPIHTAFMRSVVTVASTWTFIPKCLARSGMRLVRSTSSELEIFCPHGHKSVRDTVWRRNVCEATPIKLQYFVYCSYEATLAQHRIVVLLKALLYTVFPDFFSP